MTKYTFNPILNSEELSSLKKAWQSDLEGPQDGMWASFRNQASNWGVLNGSELIGYASIGEDNQLIQFYVKDKYLVDSNSILSAFIKEQKISQAMVGTNNPNFLTAVLPNAQSTDVHTYLFRNPSEVEIPNKEGELIQCQPNELEKMVNFYHESIGAPKKWLSGYLGGHIDKGEVFYHKEGSAIVGGCEVRVSATNPKYADIGMLVAPEYRKKGYGTYLLHKAKGIAMEWEKHPICSCEKDNIGSLKSITNCGFVSKYQLLKVIVS